MTHEEFLGLGADDSTTLTDDDRKRIERTLGWQAAVLQKALVRLGLAILAAFGLQPKQAR